PAGVARVERPVDADRGVPLPPVDEVSGGAVLGRAVLPDEPPLPGQRARVGAQLVEVLVAGPERDRARVLPAVAADRRRGIDDVPGPEAPATPAVGRDRVEPAVRRADVHRLVGPEDGRAEHALPRPVRPRAVTA